MPRRYWRSIEDGDILWVHDYHLLMLPQMIREQRPDISIGLFIHVPFPSFELFRLLPWRQEIIEGMLGADLIGFQTYDYVRHFMSSVRRLTGVDSVFNRISIGDRTLKVDVFPKGINYERFRNRALEIHSDHPRPLGHPAGDEDVQRDGTAGETDYLHWQAGLYQRNPPTNQGL